LKAFSLFATLFFIALIAGCTGTPLASPFVSPTAIPQTQPAKVKTIALVMKTLTNPFFVEMEKGARQAEKELGIKLIVKAASQETSIEQQIRIIENLIAEKVDAIVVAPGNSFELVPVIRDAQAAGIIIINIDNPLDPAYIQVLKLPPIPFIGVNNEQGAYHAAKYLSQQIKTPAQAVILEGIPDAKNAIDRTNGALRAFRETPNITVVASETAHWKIDEARDVTLRILSRWPDLRLIFCGNDMMALGAIRALEETHRSDVLVAGYDALAEVTPALQAGKLIVTIDQQAAQQGYLGVQYAFRALNGETLPLETLIEVGVITKDTLK
jgi:ribose transport system substrate-binding protein